MRSLALPVLVTLLAACGTPVYLRPRAGDHWNVRSGQALVIFLRPSGYGAWNHALIFDEKGALVAQSITHSAVGVTLSAGHYFWTVIGSSLGRLGQSRGMEANLAAGRTYYVEVGAKPGAVTDLYAHAPRMPSWAQHDEWMANVEPYELASNQADFDHDDIVGLIEEARERFSELNDEYRRERTLYRDDAVLDGSWNGLPQTGEPSHDNAALLPQRRTTTSKAQTASTQQHDRTLQPTTHACRPGTCASGWACIAGTCVRESAAPDDESASEPAPSPDTTQHAMARANNPPTPPALTRVQEQRRSRDSDGEPGSRRRWVVYPSLTALHLNIGAFASGDYQWAPAAGCGIGLRSRLSQSWALQARATVIGGYSSTSGGFSGLHLTGTGELTMRLHLTTHWYLGAGNLLGATWLKGSAAYYSYSWGSRSESVSQAIGVVGFIVETGWLLGENNGGDLSVRLTVAPHDLEEVGWAALSVLYGIAL